MARPTNGIKSHRTTAFLERFRSWVKANALISFFGLTLLLVFILLIPFVVQSGFKDSPILQLLMLYAARLGAYMPVLVGMLVTGWALPVRCPASASKRWLIFGVVWLAALTVYVLDLRRNIPEAVLGWGALIIISIPIAVLPAFVVSSAFSRVASLREYLSTLVHPRGHFVWYLVALLTFPLLWIAGSVITQLLAGEPPLSGIHLHMGIVLATLITFASVFFYSGGINEEGGWRGFAQRRLQARVSPLAANLLLWAYLVVVHIPNDLIEYREGGYLLVRFGLYPFITLLFGWVYNRTRGSILAPALFHASMNSMNTLQTAIPRTDIGQILLVIFAVLAALIDRMWKKLPSGHPGAYREPVLEGDRHGAKAELKMAVLGRKQPSIPEKQI